jgi:arylamine N-acetyltransferase
MSHFVKFCEADAVDLALQFLSHHGIAADLPPRQLLNRVAQAFSRLPYENLSKVVRHAETTLVDQVRRTPAEVLHDFEHHGAGGTCFSLTWTLMQLLRGLGFDAQLLLADRRYGIDTHSALLVLLDGMPHLLDPGYLLTNPIPITGNQAIVIPTGFQEVHLLPAPLEGRLELYTLYQQKLTYRLTYKTSPVDTATFLLAWDASFTFDMMNYPVLSRMEGDRQLYLQKNRLMIRGREGTENHELTTEILPHAMQHYFGVAPSLIQQALPLFTPSAR